MSKEKKEIKMGTRDNLIIPVLRDVKDFDRYKVEIKAWSKVTKVEKKAQAVHVALSLPTDHQSKIREKVFDNYGDLDILNAETGLESLLNFLT